MRLFARGRYQDEISGFFATKMGILDDSNPEKKEMVLESLQLHMQIQGLLKKAHDNLD